MANVWELELEGKSGKSPYHSPFINNTSFLNFWLT